MSINHSIIFEFSPQVRMGRRGGACRRARSPGQRDPLPRLRHERENLDAVRRCSFLQVIEERGAWQGACSMGERCPYGHGTRPGRPSSHPARLGAHNVDGWGWLLFLHAGARGGAGSGTNTAVPIMRCCFTRTNAMPCFNVALGWGVTGLPPSLQPPEEREVSSSLVEEWGWPARPPRPPSLF